MAKRGRIVRRRVEEPGDEPEEELDDVEPEEDTDDDFDDDVEEDIPPVLRKAPRPIVPAPKAKKAVAPAPVKTKVVEPESAPAKVKSVATAVVDNFLTPLLDSLTVGKSLVITRVGENKWQMSSADGVATGPKLRGKEYYDKVLSKEYTDWQADWRLLTFAEKKAKAKKLGVAYTDDDDPRIAAMNMSQSVREHLGIEKYKPEYTTQSSRKTMRGK